MSVPSPSAPEGHDSQSSAGGFSLDQTSNWKSGPRFGMCAAVPAAVLVWLVLHFFYPVFTNEEAADAFGILPPAIQWQLARDNAMFVMGLLGALSAGSLAVGEGLSRRSWMTGLAGGAACLMVGLLFGALAGYVGLLTFQRFEPREDLADLGKALRVYAVAFGILGAGVGLTVGLVLGRAFRVAAKCLVAGILAGGLAAICYPVLVALVLPGAVTKVFIPVGSAEQLLCSLLLLGLLGAIIPGVAQEKRPSAPERDRSAS